ncbi:MAG: hypothetical protein IPH57_16245 [Saprospiraceae bacterium]|nr:hypothetical protein [Saprospiraceae bacterium]
MKFIVLFIFAGLTISCSAQNFDKKYKLGFSYAPVIDYKFFNSESGYYTTWDHFYNINSRLQIYKKWFFGAEIIFAYIDGMKEDNPFYIGGLNFEYNISHIRKFSTYAKLGYYIGNLVIYSNQAAQKINTNYLNGGANIEYNLFKPLWISLGLSAQYPLADISDKEISYQAYVGLLLKF